ncbi:MAG: hypothetical protein HYW95_02965 [Candidatus Wildermuthbacteria bacterium]|nr:hypothetical protein [Candidatus Wildermuthbacteria bacterium]
MNNMQDHMPLEVRKNERETNLSLIRRFTKRLRASGILNSAKRARFRARPKSEQTKKKAAIRRLEKRQEYEKLVKLGKI